MVRGLHCNKMLTYDFGYWFIMLSLCSRHTDADETVFKRQTDSFIVSANYDVQSRNVNNQVSNSYERPPTTSTTTTDSKGPNAWKGSHHENDPQIYVTDAYHQSPATDHLSNLHLVDNGLGSNKSTTTTASTQQLVTTPAPSVQWYTTKYSHERSDLDNSILSDAHTHYRPSIEDLQQIISKLVRGATKVHQVVKVPAMYEIHLQEEEVKPNDFKIPLPDWQKPRDSRPSSRLSTKTWNLPSKIRYFEQTGRTETTRPVYGKYSYPKPFSVNKWASSKVIGAWNHPNHGSVSVPMSPGSTAVTFLDHNQQNIIYRPQVAAPDLSLYYAKKREIENGSSSNKYAYRRNGETRGHRDGRLKRRGNRGLHSHFDGMKYVIHVREKPSK